MFRKKDDPYVREVEHDHNNRGRDGGERQECVLAVRELFGQRRTAGQLPKVSCVLQKGDDAYGVQLIRTGVSKCCSLSGDILVNVKKDGRMDC